MEENNNNAKKEESNPQEQNNEKEKSKEAKENPNQNIYDQYQKEKDNLPEKISKSEGQGNASNPYVQSNSEKDQNSKEGEKDDQPQEKLKRRRRGKSEINDRKYHCPDCEKCYLSGPALTTHRKTKHGYGVEGVNTKKRGRPKKEGQTEGGQNTQNKYNNFFNADHRKKINQEILDEKKENEEGKNEEKAVELNKIKDILIKIFNQTKEQIFQNIENIDKYTFYNLIVENWEKDESNLFPPEERFCYSIPVRKDETPTKLNSYNLDQLFFNYLKEFSKKVNDDYLWFMFKFIVLFRECINLKNKEQIRPENKSDKRQLFTQIYNAETVPEACNYFFLDFLMPYDNFGLNKDELIELVQHFCYWLYINQYTQSHLTLLEE
jgi:hypothetical protein